MTHCTHSEPAMQRQALRSAARSRALCLSARVQGDVLGSQLVRAWQPPQQQLPQAASHAALTHVCSRGFAAGPALDLDPERRRALLNRLSYRAKQRGFLELDLLMGDWAERNLPDMNDEELTGFAVVLDQENPELFKWLTGQLPPPQDMMENPAFKKLLAHVTAFLDENSQKTTRGKLGKEWVRGWGDSGLPSSGNQQ